MKFAAVSRHIALPPKFALVPALLLIMGVMACGGAKSEGDGEGGAGGEEQGGSGGNAAGSGGKGGEAGKTTENGGSGGGGTAGATGGSGGGGGSGGVSATGGAAGGAAGGMGGVAMGTGGSAPVGNSDKTKEKVWFHGDINLASSMSANVSTPSNWLAPINYYDGQILVRLVVTKGVPDLGRIEICMSKTGGSDPKHTCPTLISNFSGVGEFFKQNTNAGGLLLNVLAKATMTKSDFETPFATSEFLLVKEHGVSLAGPVMGKLTLVLVPQGLTFSGWAGYPK